ncbi:sugar hydrolase [Paenibacillus sp. WLX2291]|uniref:alpha-L-rhamnosidase-related protein n=1 Tax=Paenibacillus sp. WLX2291 TaxID=3296934 RepID=UPI0039843F22
MSHPSLQRITEQRIVENKAFATTAESLLPVMHHTDVLPVRLVTLVPDDQVIHGWRTADAGEPEQLEQMTFGKGDEVVLDFGQHLVGQLSLHIEPIGSPPDAPLHLKLTFGEMPVELAVPFAEYDGWLSSSWLQEQSVYIDVLPTSLVLERRYSFRYVKLEVIASSVKYNVSFRHVNCRTVSSADMGNVQPLNHMDAELNRMDEVSIKTLADCMQEVFEDGPKRDRRLWLGDLRLQALASYTSLPQPDLVKRCLYLFAAYPNEQGQVSANLFIKPHVIPDDTYLFDYSLFFVSVLYDYVQATGDMETLAQLWSTAHRQVELALQRLDEQLIVRDTEEWWSFIDWRPQLNKQAPSQGVLIYALRQAAELAHLLHDEQEAELRQWLDKIVDATLEQLWDEQQGYFVSGHERQVSQASQIWMVLAGVLDQRQNRELLNRMLQENVAVPLTTPYMVHHLIEALILAGDHDTAISEMKAYWGGMLNDGADTFWELYDPQDKEFSPYGSHLINSYCHAWSCTPTYLLRKYNL